ncbi:MFS transporter [Cupriavidus sp. CuC1]|uniref:MFS transporter n=1 Tax=Cupriavidus sp. CuC1 TaxID=3373131 RepID=UPI0037D5B41E
MSDSYRAASPQVVDTSRDATSTTLDGMTGRRAVTAAVVGNLLEWYDFAVYGYLATLIAKKFFATGDELVALMSTFAAFGVGFVVRPLGGIVIGRLADVKGRKAALMLTIFLMAAGTFLIGLIPTYESIGVLAPVLLVLARLMQGFSAGGEWGGSTAFIVEWAPDNRRGFYGSFQQASVAAGLLLGSGVAALFTTALSADQMDSWGWRIPFLLGGILAPVGIYMRRNIDESPAFREVQETKAAATPISGLALAGKAFGFTVLWSVAYYTILSYMPTFTQKFAGLSRTASLWSNTLGLVVLVVAIPLAGHLSDRAGRKPLLLTSCLAFVALPYPLFNVLVSGATLATVVSIQVLFALMIAAFSGPGPAAIAEIFPTSVRSTWMSVGYSLATAIFGGFAPLIATWLIGKTGSPISPAYYLVAAAVTTTLVIWSLRETAHDKLK